MPGRFVTDILFSHHCKRILRVVLFLYLALAVCPIHYWQFIGETDNTWLFAMNYAAAHHMIMGRDFVWTYGPLLRLVAPMDIGNNLAQALAFQAGLWAVILAILWDVFFRAEFPLRNLLFFSAFLGLSSSAWFSLGDQLFVGALVLLVHFRLRGGIVRYLAALLLLGLFPLIKFIGLVMVAGVTIGLFLDQTVRHRSTSWREPVLALVVPAFVTFTGYWLTMGSFESIRLYLKGSLELSRGYGLAMSLNGPRLESLDGLGVFVLLVSALALVAARDLRVTMYLSLLLGLPLFVSMKHSFVRQDEYHMAYFSFVATALGLTALATPLEGRRKVLTQTAITVLLAILCQNYLVNVKNPPPTTIANVPVLNAPSLIWRALHSAELRRTLSAESQQSIPSALRVDPEVKAIVQREPVASLSESYRGAFLDGLNLVIYPVLQRYSAYTPYLDKLNADWVRTQGPQFLTLNAESMSIDGRHPWTETPAMWAEVYRWYDTRMIGTRTLLLERRATPRFSRFESIGHLRLQLGEELSIPASPQPIFWSMQCSLTAAGRLEALLFRVDAFTMTVKDQSGHNATFRVLPEVLGSPSLGNYLPSTLSQFSDLFQPAGPHNSFVNSLSFGGPGAAAYSPFCEVQFLEPVR
jgi:hypothetical protein